MQLETIGDVWTHGVRILMRCAHGRPDGMKHRPRCLYSATLDVETLVCTRGRDFPVHMLRARDCAARAAARGGSA